jgi:hypothetical protein
VTKYDGGAENHAMTEPSNWQGFSDFEVFGAEQPFQ